MMEDIDIKNFTTLSSADDNDSILLARTSSQGEHGKISVSLLRAVLEQRIKPTITDGMWYIGGVSTGIKASGEDGKTPIFMTGAVTTGLPDTDVIVQVRYDGIDENLNPYYLIDFTIPAGKPGKDGDGAGNVYVTPDTLKSGKLYLFQPGADGSANGTMVEFDNQGGVGQQYPGYSGAEIFNDYAGNIAAGKNAHAEGQETKATGPRAHAEGYKTSVYAADAHAEGRNTWAMGAQSHVEGLYGIGWGAVSHTEGCVVTDFGVGEGSYTLLNDEELVRDFLNTCATQEYPDGTEGAYYYRITEHALSAYRLHGALGNATHAEGINNIVCDQAGHVEGCGNVCGDMIPGHGQDPSMYAPHAEGYFNKVASRVWAPHVGGAYCTVAGGNYSFAHGYNLSVSNDYETAFGRYNLSEQNGKKVLFAYGIGTSDSNRQNAFAVLEDGTVVIPKMAGGNASEIVDEKLYSIQNRLTNMYNELTAVISKQQERIDSLVSLVGQYHPGGEKAYVIQDVLFFTDLMDVAFEGGTLSISDAGASVTNGVLTIN